MFQQQAPGDRQRYVRKVEKTRKTSLNPDDYNQLMKQKHIILAKKIKPMSYRGTEAIRKLSEDYSSRTLSMDAAVTMDHQWLLSRLAPTKLFDIDIQPGTQQCPSWSSFNSAHCTTKLDTSVIGYCPMLNYPSTDPKTIYTVMSNLQKMMCTLNQKHAIITFDLALYKIAKEIQWSRPIEFGNVIIRLGGFHIITNYLSALGTMHASSGLKEVLVESGVLTGVTVNQVFAGKHYKRGVMVHKLLYEVLSRLKLLSLGEWLESSGMDDPLESIEISHDSSQEILQQAAERVIQSMKEFDSSVGEATMFQFWDMYRQSVQVLLCFIRSERTGNWELYLDSMRAMLPVMFSYDRCNYSRWLPIYIADMLNLHVTAPEVYEKFSKGAFAINRSGNSFAGLPTDMVLEQTINRDSKTSGGLIGISNDPNTRMKWFITTHLRASLLTAQREIFTGSRSDVEVSSQHENTTTMTMQDEAWLQAIISVFERFRIKPFSPQPLVNQLMNRQKR